MKKHITQLKNEIFSSIKYGEYTVKSIETEGNWNRMAITIDDIDFIIGVHQKSNCVVIHNLEMVSNLFTKEEIISITNELNTILI